VERLTVAVWIACLRPRRRRQVESGATEEGGLVGWWHKAGGGGTLPLLGPSAQAGRSRAHSRTGVSRFGKGFRRKVNCCSTV